MSLPPIAGSARHMPKRTSQPVGMIAASGSVRPASPLAPRSRMNSSPRSSGVDTDSIWGAWESCTLRRLSERPSCAGIGLWKRSVVWGLRRRSTTVAWPAYLTTDAREAAVYAALAAGPGAGGGGDVYAVEPLEELEPDPSGGVANSSLRPRRQPWSHSSVVPSVPRKPPRRSAPFC
jgi:hypothetical protein